MVNNADMDEYNVNLSDSPIFVAGFLDSKFLLGDHYGEDGGHKGVVDSCSSHGVARGASCNTNREGGISG